MSAEPQVLQTPRRLSICVFRRRSFIAVHTSSLSSSPLMSTRNSTTAAAKGRYLSAFRWVRRKEGLRHLPAALEVVWTSLRSCSIRTIVWSRMQDIPPLGFQITSVSPLIIYTCYLLCGYRPLERSSDHERRRQSLDTPSVQATSATQSMAASVYSTTRGFLVRLLPSTSGQRHRSAAETGMAPPRPRISVPRQ